MSSKAYFRLLPEDHQTIDIIASDCCDLGLVEVERLLRSIYYPESIVFPFNFSFNLQLSISLNDDGKYRGR